MMDLREKKSGLDSRDVEKKSCSDCRTTKTPLWRLGPAGPKTLCNACGIKYNKKRRQLLGLDRGRNQSGKKKMKNQKRSNGVGRSVKMMRLMALGREMGLNLSSANFGEEDAAAILLLALSYAR